jgi:hypothetical protein
MLPTWISRCASALIGLREKGEIMPTDKNRGRNSAPLPLPFKYLSELAPAKIALWCYLVWYLVTVAAHFDPSPRLWLSSLGISAIVGFALLLSVQNEHLVSNGWQTFRLFLMPFCVSSFSALIKGQEYFLVLPSRPLELGWSISLCAIFVLLVLALKRTQRRVPA